MDFIGLLKVIGSKAIEYNCIIMQFLFRYKQKSLQLFKLILLERKVIFFKSPVSDLSGNYFICKIVIHYFL